MNKETQLAIDLGGTNIRIGQVLNGEIIKRHQEEITHKNDLSLSLDQVKKNIKEMITPNVESIGIGVPSAVDVVKGIVYNVTNIPSWVEVPLKSILEEEFKIPVYINNDVNCFTLAEHRYGKGKGYSSVVGITIGTGLGAGLIINNKLYAGNNAGAGEIGMLQYLDRDLEFYCSSSFFSEIHHTTGKDLFQEAQNGNEQSLAIWDEFGKHISQAIKYIMLAYDPEIVIIGGSISLASSFFKKAMFKGISNFAFPKTVERLRIEFTQNIDNNIIGASLLHLQ